MSWHELPGSSSRPILLCLGALGLPKKKGSTWAPQNCRKRLTVKNENGENLAPGGQASIGMRPKEGIYLAAALRLWFVANRRPFDWKSDNTAFVVGPVPGVNLPPLLASNKGCAMRSLYEPSDALPQTTSRQGQYENGEATRTHPAGHRSSWALRTTRP